MQRSRQWLRWLTFLTLLLLLAACDSPPPIRPLTPASTVLAFGDSLTHGTGAERGESYPDVLERLLGCRVINAGEPGEVTAAGRERLPGLLEKHRPGLVILCHGGNDFLQRLDRSRTRDNLTAMVELIRAEGADVVLVGVPQFGFVLEPPEFYRQIAEHYQLPYEAEIVSDLLSDRDLKSDTIHPNAKGYRLMAEALYALIEEAESG